MLDIPERVKELLKNTECRKELVITFPNGEFEAITNENIISESAQFTESICSQEELEFGLCELSVIKFSTVFVGNIKGCKIDVTLYIGEELYPIPYGRFIVNECKRNSSNMQVRDIVAYSELLEDTLDFSAYNTIAEFSGSDTEYEKISKFSFNDLKNLLFKGHLEKNTPEKTLKDTGNLYTYRQKVFSITGRTKNHSSKSGDRYVSPSSQSIESIYANGNIEPNCAFFVKNARITGAKLLVFDKSTNQTEYIDITLDTDYIDANYIIERIPTRYTFIQETGYKYYRVESVYTNIETDVYEMLLAFDTDYYEVAVTGYVPSDIQSGKIVAVKSVGGMPISYSKVNQINDKLNELLDDDYKYIKTHDSQYGNYVDDVTKLALKAGASLLITSGGAFYNNGSGLAPIYTKTIDYDIYSDSDYRIIPLVGNTTVAPQYNGFTTVYVGDKYVFPVITDNGYVFTGPYDRPPVLWLPQEIKILYHDGSEIMSVSGDENCDIVYHIDDFNGETDYMTGLYTKLPYTKIPFADSTTYEFLTVDGRMIAQSQKRDTYKLILPDVSEIRNMMEGFLELQGSFGKIGRNGDFEELKLEPSDLLYPDTTINPGNDVFPGGSSDIGYELYTKKIYQRCWYDDELTKLYGAIYCKYKDKDDNDVEYTHIIDNRGADNNYKVYDVSNNYIIQNNKFGDSDIKDVLARMSNEIKNIQYISAQISAKGLPYVEAGDMILAMCDGEFIKTYMMRRTIKGIQQLTDSITTN